MAIAGRAGPKRQIDLLKDAVGLAVVAGVTAQRGFDGVGRHGSGNSLSIGSSDRDRQQAVGQAEPIVERPADVLGLGGATGDVPAVQQRCNGGKFVALQPFGGGDLLLQPRRVDPRPHEHFAFEIRRQPPGDDLQDVCFAVVEAAFLVREDPERAKEHGGRRDRHANGGGKILGHVPCRHDAVVVEHDRMAQEGFEIGHGSLQRSGGRGEAIRGQAVRATQLQLGCGFIEEIDAGGVAIDRVDARPENGLQPCRQVLLFLAVRNHGHAGGQLGFALPQSVPRLQQLAKQVGDGAGQRSDSPVRGFAPTDCRGIRRLDLFCSPFFLFVPLSFLRCRRFEHKATGRIARRFAADGHRPCRAGRLTRLWTVLVPQRAAGGGLERSQEFRQAPDGFRSAALRALAAVPYRVLDASAAVLIWPRWYGDGKVRARQPFLGRPAEGVSATPVDSLRSE